MTMYGDKMYVSDILDAKALEEHIRNGYVTARRHPHLPLVVLNYTPKTQYENLWNDVTMRCRGLVVDINTKEIVANCMKKFFNRGQHEQYGIKLEGRVQVTDKLDGSMGNVAFYEGELVVTTRGSFESEQAQFAYNHIMTTPGYFEAFKTLCGGDVTAVVEIIYPENRIVVDYGDMHDVVLIGAIANNELKCGKQLWIPADKVYSWPGPVVEKFNATSFEDALRIPPRPNSEGIVIYFEKTGERLKIKYPDYVRIHKAVFSYSPKKLVDEILEGRSAEEYIAALPDELHQSINLDLSTLKVSFDRLYGEIMMDYNAVSHLSSRKDFAQAALESKHSAALFMLFDGRSIDSYVWNLVRNSL